MLTNLLELIPTPLTLIQTLNSFSVESGFPH